MKTSYLTAKELYEKRLSSDDPNEWFNSFVSATTFAYNDGKVLIRNPGEGDLIVNLPTAQAPLATLWSVITGNDIRAGNYFCAADDMIEKWQTKTIPEDINNISIEWDTHQRDLAESELPPVPLTGRVIVPSIDRAYSGCTLEGKLYRKSAPTVREEIRQRLHATESQDWDKPVITSTKFVKEHNWLHVYVPGENTVSYEITQDTIPYDVWEAIVTCSTETSSFSGELQAYLKITGAHSIGCAYSYKTTFHETNLQISHGMKGKIIIPQKSADIGLLFMPE